MQINLTENVLTKMHTVLGFLNCLNDLLEEYRNSLILQQ